MLPAASLVTSAAPVKFALAACPMMLADPSCTCTVKTEPAPMP